MAGQCSVLIVDGSEESREVLKTALERRGVHTYTASHVQRGVELARELQPDLIVLDLETDEDVPGDATAPLAEVTQGSTTSLVVLGTVRRHERMPGEFVAKPYHYGPLILKIEELLGQRGYRSARGAGQSHVA